MRQSSTLPVRRLLAGPTRPSSRAGSSCKHPTAQRRPRAFSANDQARNQDRAPQTIVSRERPHEAIRTLAMWFKGVVFPMGGSTGLKVIRQLVPFAKYQVSRAPRWRRSSVSYQSTRGCVRPCRLLPSA